MKVLFYFILSLYILFLLLHLQGHGNVHFDSLSKMLSHMREVPDAFKEAGKESDWNDIVNQFCRIYGKAEYKNLHSRLEMRDAPFRPFAKRSEQVLMGSMICRKEETADMHYDKSTGKRELDEDVFYPNRGGLDFPLSLPCCIAQIPALIFTSIADCFCGPSKEPTPENTEYLKRKFQELGTEVETVNIYQSLEEALQAYAKELNDKYNRFGIYCSYFAEKSVTKKEFTCGYLHKRRVYRQASCTVGGLWEIHRDQFTLLFYKK